MNYPKPLIAHLEVLLALAHNKNPDLDAEGKVILAINRLFLSREELQGILKLAYFIPEDMHMRQSSAIWRIEALHYPREGSWSIGVEFYRV